MQPFDLTSGDQILNQNALANNASGMNLSVRTDLGTRVEAWRPGPGVTGDERFFCHGYALGTFGAHMYTVWGRFLPQVLAEEYEALGRVDIARNVAARDVLVWWLGATDAYHSAVVEQPVTLPTGALDLAQTRVSSKTGTGPLWVGLLADDVKQQYRSAAYIEVYRRHP
ncbi:hypothetical protein [Micromonospora peucetia]|uniref:Uncharacterized protein n=1 Tax=Micromonospora peucetia TaxID=47871 RepID=A0ABZ1E961_9ACTN|nr:hypothetical protein [Micromonospora peucetia]WSA31359.1 hypothetical protein OIE14_24955 [Micromonospora peucetia]